MSDRLNGMHVHWVLNTGPEERHGACRPAHIIDDRNYTMDDLGNASAHADSEDATIDCELAIMVSVKDFPAQEQRAGATPPIIRQIITYGATHTLGRWHLASRCEPVSAGQEYAKVTVVTDAPLDAEESPS